MSMTAPLEAVPELEVRKHPPSTLENIDVGSPGGSAGAGDLGAPTINGRKRRWQAPWEAVPEL
jgi:hypothetical protein